MITILLLLIAYFRNLVHAIKRCGSINWPKVWKVIQVEKKVTVHPKSRIFSFLPFSVFYVFTFFHVFHRQLANMWSIVSFEIPK